MKFWDSSAMVPLLLDEPRSGMLRAIAAADGSIAVWWGSPVEFCSAVGRLRRDGVITVGEEDELADPNVLAFAWVVDFPMFA